jgi:hypothetical protein
MSWAALLQAAGALAAVVGLAIMLSRAARRSGLAPNAQAVTRARHRMALQAVLPLEGRRAAMILAVDGREVLLIAGPNGETVVGWLPPS